MYNKQENLQKMSSQTSESTSNSKKTKNYQNESLTLSESSIKISKM